MIQIPEGSIVRATLRALISPKRLAPLLLVAASLVFAQVRFSRDPLAMPLGILMCLVFVAVAPVSYRVLFPEGLDFSHGGVRLVLYAAVGSGVVLSSGYVLPKLLRMGPTFLTQPVNLAVCGALYLVGGWGLGRDIGFEESLARERAKAARLQLEAEQAQLLALRSHLDPHFLFNTLNAIAEWCRDDPAVAEAATLKLAAMLRAVLEGIRAPTWPLAAELTLLRQLFELHEIRDRERYRLVADVAEPIPDAHVPPMLLLPLAENAITHGPAAGHTGPIVLAVRAGEGTVELALRNPGAFTGRREGGEGIAMVERRLALAYRGHARLSIRAADGGTVTELSIPLRPLDQETP